MPVLIRKHMSLSHHNISKVRELAVRYDLSESELVRRAIQAYDPEQPRPASTPEDQEKVAEAVLDHVQTALGAAIKAVESANVRIDETLVSLNDPNRRISIALEVRKEMDGNPGFLDEVSYMMAGANRSSGESS
ncbi:ribbon-helix-helix domain-containing protein [Marinobacter subterrani]|uniref:Ribbon-helix-helix protein, copG family n=1 Tax=Marinobacter subterrani TaxID=1658765 RepID=A0A0J7J864_9GAMM|nr:hypothetical protein [Marinobacter subterrani]KMQ74392.1 hypothetical protein Msub_10575 [Marinobacter subterrani]